MAAPGPPVLTRVDPLGPTEIFVTWSGPSQPNGEIVNYTIIVTRLSSSTRKRRANGTGPIIVQVKPELFYRSVKSLTADTSYNVSMFAETSEGRGSSSDTVLVWTPKISDTICHVPCCSCC